jgi:hypothetical protein
VYDPSLRFPEVIAVTTGERNLAADLLQVQQLEIMITRKSSIATGAASGPLAGTIAAE